MGRSSEVGIDKNFKTRTMLINSSLYSNPWELLFDWIGCIEILEPYPCDRSDRCDSRDILGRFLDWRMTSIHSIFVLYLNTGGGHNC